MSFVKKPGLNLILNSICVPHFNIARINLHFHGLNKHNCFKRYKSIRQGSYFGDIEVLKQVPRKYNIQADIDCSLLTMNRNLVYTIMADFPITGEEMRDIAELRDKINQNSRKKCLADLKLRQTPFEKIISPPVPPPPKRVQPRKKSEPSSKLQLGDVWKSIDLIEERAIQLTETHQAETKEIESRVEQIEDKISYCDVLTSAALERNENRSRPRNGHRLWPQTSSSKPDAP